MFRATSFDGSTTVCFVSCFDNFSSGQGTTALILCMWLHEVTLFSISSLMLWNSMQHASVFPRHGSNSDLATVKLLHHVPSGHAIWCLEVRPIEPSGTCFRVDMQGICCESNEKDKNWAEDGWKGQCLRLEGGGFLYCHREALLLSTLGLFSRELPIYC